MAYTKHLCTIVPVEPGSDIEVIRWLARESFENVAAGDFLHIVEYLEEVIPAEEIPPKTAAALGRPLDEYQWWKFSAVASAQSV